MNAVRHKQLPTAQMLLQAGAHPDTRDDRGHTPLMFAAENSAEPIGQPDAGPLNFDNCIIRLLLNTKLVDIDRQDKEGGTVLCYAAMEENTLALELLLEHGADPNIRNESGVNHFVSSARYYLEILEGIENIFSRGFDINAYNEKGSTPLHYAAESGNLAFFKFLLDRGANLDIKCSTNRNLLSYAAEGGSEDIFNVALARMPDSVTNIDNHGRSPLIYVAKNGFLFSVDKLLSDPRVDPDLKDTTQNSPLSYAALE